MTITKYASSLAVAIGLAAGTAPLAAKDAGTKADEETERADATATNAVATAAATTVVAQPTTTQQSDAPPALPPGVSMDDSVFDETWLTVGIGAGYVPSYSGSDDYVFFPLPLVAGRVGGVGITPSGAGVSLDLLSPEAGQAPGASQDVQFSLGPAISFRNDRASQIEDPVVEAAGELDTAIELGANGGVTFPGVFNPFDTVTVGATVRWDVLGAHEGMIVDPSITYFTPLSEAAIVTLSASAQFVDGDFAQYYYSVSPAQSDASGLPQFEAEGGLNSIGLTAIGAYDLDGNALNGGLSVFGIGGYSKLMNDAADTPYTAIRGDADQWFGGLGIAYTF
ncbi:MAG: MipA/OmpV family protein [Erythrobacter sp.]